MISPLAKLSRRIYMELSDIEKIGDRAQADWQQYQISRQELGGSLQTSSPKIDARSSLLTRKLAFDGDFKVAFGGAFGEDGQSGFTANFHAKFEVDFFDFCTG